MLTTVLEGFWIIIHIDKPLREKIYPYIVSNLQTSVSETSFEWYSMTSNNRTPPTYRTPVLGSPRNLYESLGIPRGSRGPGGSGRTPGMRNAPSLWIHKDSGEILGQGGVRQVTKHSLSKSLIINVAHYPGRSSSMQIAFRLEKYGKSESHLAIRETHLPASATIQKHRRLAIRDSHRDWDNSYNYRSLDFTTFEPPNFET